MVKAKKWFTRSVDATLKALGSSRVGLNEKEARKKLDRYGPNKLAEAPRPSKLVKFISQFGSAPVLMLIAAIIILVLLSLLAEQDHWTDSLVIFIVIFLNATMGYLQEEKAEKALDALKKLTSPKVKVKRKGHVRIIDAEKVVPGDILSLGEGDKVPADARIIELVALELDESLITGESLPVRKITEKIKDPKAGIGDRLNSVFMGTIVTRGRGLAVVTSTGMETEMGKIAKSIQGEEETPLQKKLDLLGKQISLMAIAAVIVLFIVRMILPDPDIFESFLLSVSLAVAIIPEGLPIVMLVTLAIGMQIMAKKNAIIRRLPAVEALGSTTVICTDKTGTLTKNQMTVREMWIGGKEIKVKGLGYDPKGKLIGGAGPVDPRSPALHEALKTMILCNDSNLVFKDDQWSVIGDPTEGALLVVGGKAGLNPQALLLEFPRSGEKVFDPIRKMMSTIHISTRTMVSYIKGAPEVLIELASNIYDGDHVIPLTEEKKKEVLEVNKRFAGKSYRVLALGTKELKGDEDQESDDLEKGLTFIGIVGIMDPVRKDAKSAVMATRKAGIKVVMITGDQPATAKAVATELGIWKKRKGQVLTGIELEDMSDDDFEEIVEDVMVYARVSPEHKMRIVRALKKRGQIVAMTGDGVNDAPALKSADIGISMGLSGTDVAREASDMVLTDDKFKSIVGAVEEGRKIYDNIRKFIRYQLSTNVGALFLLYVATLVLPVAIPMYPVQVLWVNIMMDGPPAVALGFESTNPNLMKRPPRNPKESILSKMVLRGLAFNGIFMGLAAFLLFWWGITHVPAGMTPLSDGHIAHAQTLTFTGFVMFQMFNVFNCRSFHRSSFSISLKSNKFLFWAVTVSILLQLCVVYLLPFQVLFKTVPLDLTDWALISGLGLCVLLLEEAKKIWMRSGDT